ncbi:phospholipid/glycerol acyltransferase (plasmid) [Gemmatirosa kalamazoonensis]|uniref:Phospholipid/glycerol acyltransferase n=1 Tax=Gemmatirosa kalamazoonensis TaxID=861299 RepID=W0RS88_9BACT|nr:1-acyl-sn-glycerol-3-phosphate acyltransferase [Gemmatirosa kalamazoonensis]AHG92458.1 phospholipid/glycerol acyltransferase [Gemmatirosa kalamazoonensis]
MSPHVHVSRLATLVARLFYRLELAGERPPARGPLLAVANHPNSLLDPALVTLAVGRPVRFLAKAPLFTDASVGWLVRASGAIPVYRRQDGAVPSGANDDSLRAAESALVAGDAIALFPEGISHASPGLAPLKTGAARLALGVAARLGGAFPIVPVGITLDDRATFRSRGLVALGDAVSWDDLATAAARDGADPVEATRVRELTARIERAIAAVTVSYESWEDARLIALADEVQLASTAPSDTPHVAGGERLERRRLGATVLARLRADGDDAPHGELRAEVAALGGELRRHARLLHALRLRPRDLALRTDAATALHWAGRRAYLLLLAALAAVGSVLGWIPYRLTAPIAARFPGASEVDVRATAKALIGGAVFLAWIVLLAVVAWWRIGWWAALATLVLVPPLLVVALMTNEATGAAWRDARRFLTLRRRADRVAELRARQAALAHRIEAVVARLDTLQH